MSQNHGDPRQPCALIGFFVFRHNAAWVSMAGLPGYLESLPVHLFSMHSRQAELVPPFPGDRIADQEFEADDAFAIPAQLAIELQSVPAPAAAKAGASIAVPRIFSSAVA